MILSEQSFGKMTLFLIKDWDSFQMAMRSLALHCGGQR